MKTFKMKKAFFLAMTLGIALWATEPSESPTPLTGERPAFGFAYFNDKSIDDLIQIWASDNPNLRSISALETARRVWQAENPVAKLQSIIPEMLLALESDNPNRRRAVSDFVYGLWRVGGKYKGLKIRLSDREKIEGTAEMRKALGVLLPVVIKNIKDDPHVWARVGAVDLVTKIIPPYNKPEDGHYEGYAEKVRPLLLLRSKDDDKFMKQAAAIALNAIGIKGLEAKEIVDCMTGLIDTQVAKSAEEAFKVLGLLSNDHLSSISDVLIESLGSDVVGTAAGIVSTRLLLKLRPPGTTAAVIDHVTRDRHGYGTRAMEFFPLIPQFSNEELRTALPELNRLAQMEEVKGRRSMSRAEITIKKLSKLEKLKPTQMIELNNAKKLVANPPHIWVLKLFDRMGEPRPKVGPEVTGGNPLRDAKVTNPPWIPKNRDEPVFLSEQDALYGMRAMDLLPSKKGRPLPIDMRAFSNEKPETSCGFLNIQLPYPEVDLRRPLGPTGILGTFSNRRILVMGTQPGSPSDGNIRTGDWILGVNGRYFTSEPRIGMAYAIEESEGKADGLMTLEVLRKGKVVDVAINLEALGRHVDTWPYGCEKSKKILGKLCEFIVDHDAKWVIPGALVLLASGDDKYLPKIRREVYRIAESGPSNSNWSTSYQLMTLCEYYQRVGDSNILPTIKAFADHITSGQTYFGGYLHNKSYFNEWQDASKVGYGEMNMAGAPALISLILANECGVELNNTAYRKSIDYFKIFSGRGCVPYGAHSPYIDMPETGGKTVAVAVGFDLLGDASIAKPFVTMNSSAYEHMWTGYHGGSYWNATWRPLSVARDSVDAFKTLTRYNLWHYNLSRNWFGGITAPVRTRADFSMNHDPALVIGFGMIYSLPQKAIRLTGAPRSVFSKMSALGMVELKNIYDSRDAEALEEKIQELKRDSNLNDKRSSVLDELLLIAKRRSTIEALEMKELEEALLMKDFFKAEEMLKAMTQAGISVLDRFKKTSESIPTEALSKGDRYFQSMRKIKSGPQPFGPGEIKQMKELEKEGGYYGNLSRETMKKFSLPVSGAWKVSELEEVEKIEKENVGWLFYLISPNMDELRKIRMKSWITKVGAPHPVDDLETHSSLKNWYAMDYDDSQWPVELGPYLISEKPGSEQEAHVLQRYNFLVKQGGEIDDLFLKLRFGPRDFKGTLYLNGEAIVEFLQSPCVRGRSRGHRKLGQKTTYLKLPTSAKALLKEGRNVLALRADLPPNSSYSHAWMRMVDVGLGATRKGGGKFSYDPMVKGE
jgi:hypothetical protein